MWSSQWRHNEHNGVSNHQPHHCLLNRLFRRRSKKTSKLRITGLCAGNSPVTGEFPAQMASNVENVSSLMTSSCFGRVYNIWPTENEHQINQMRLNVCKFGYAMGHLNPIGLIEIKSYEINVLHNHLYLNKTKNDKVGTYHLYSYTYVLHNIWYNDKYAGGTLDGSGWVDWRRYVTIRLFLRGKYLNPVFETHFRNLVHKFDFQVHVIVWLERFLIADQIFDAITCQHNTMSQLRQIQHNQPGWYSETCL